MRPARGTFGRRLRERQRLTGPLWSRELRDLNDLARYWAETDASADAVDRRGRFVRALRGRHARRP